MKKQKILKPSEMSKLFGGKTIKTQGKTVTNSTTGCQTTITDSYEDNNGNGHLDCGETHSETVTIVCPN
ncbi:hypothetical protein GCM10023210_28900 [Chryseobacterium ginsengisoli]|uniref:Bacteriocin n=2 Tax=Chryseobacterium ginsengisoli TaxID=363853 RepID=A0ABP9MFA3_9FLAO